MPVSRTFVYVEAAQETSDKSVSSQQVLRKQMMQKHNSISS